MMKKILQLENVKTIAKKQQTIIIGGHGRTAEEMATCRKNCEDDFLEDGLFPKYMNCMADCVPSV